MQRLFKHTFFLLLLVGAFNLIGTNLYLYWTVWWYDMPMHFFAGFTAGMATVWFWGYLFGVRMHLWKTIVFSVFGSLIIGLLWEAYELYFGVTSLSDGILFWSDTASDVVLDLCGGFLGGLYAFKLLK